VRGPADEVEKVAQSSRSGSAPVKSQARRVPGRRADKAGVGGAAGAPEPCGWARHLDGWQPAVVAIFIAGSTAALAVPRPVEPADVPLPLADPRALARAVASDEARAAALDPGVATSGSIGGEAPSWAPAQPAERKLDVDVRELGSAVRAFGLADAAPERRDDAIVAARGRLVAAFGPALAQGAEAVLALRAWQQRAFVRAVRRWEATGEETDDLRALGGDFLGLLRRSGWVEESPGERAGARRVAPDGVVLGVLFKKRWNKVVGVQGPPFEPTLDEERALYRFLLTNPLHEAPQGARDGASAGAARAAARRRADEYRLKKIGELAALDPAYPHHLARGVVLYRLGRYADAAAAFQRHLDASPEGAHALRSRNYLRAALGRGREEGL
jgi:hypothetical protein